MPIIDSIAVANIEALLIAKPPDRVLHEPRKHLRERTVELPGIDLAGNRPNDIGAAVWPVTASAIRMGGVEPVQDPGSVQKIVHQRIDRDRRHADFEPPGANGSSTNQNAGQGHGEHLVRYAVNIAQRVQQSGRIAGS